MFTQNLDSFALYAKIFCMWNDHGGRFRHTEIKCAWENAKLPTPQKPLVFDDAPPPPRMYGEIYAYDHTRMVICKDHWPFFDKWEVVERDFEREAIRCATECVRAKFGHAILMWGEEESITPADPYDVEEGEPIPYGEIGLCVDVRVYLSARVERAVWAGGHVIRDNGTQEIETWHTETVWIIRDKQTGLFREMEDRDFGPSTYEDPNWERRAMGLTAL